jgi:pimeloyl-ACP methyl ester carboxylesterase
LAAQIVTYQQSLGRLEPHENHHTDVVLLGHSMGGILSAEVALKAPNSPATGRAFHHRILGTVNFDTPFLGMHPGVISSGIGSLFRPAPEPPGSKPNQPSNAGSDTAYGSSQGSTSLENQALSTSEWDASSQLSAVQSMASQLSSPSPGDPFFDPPFPNDVRREQRKGWPNFLHFINKHSENLATATMNYFMSHVEFGGCLADYPRLKNRCDRLRALEDVDELVDLDSLGYRSPIRRIRFVNYYTASSGRPKAPKMASEQLVDEDEHLTPIEVEMKDMSLDHPGSISWTPTSSSSVQGQTDNDIRPPEQPCNEQDTSPIQVQEQSPGDRLEVQETLQELPEMRYIDSIPIDDDYDPPVEAAIINSIETSSSDLPPDLESISLEPGLPPIPEIPVEPESIDLNLYTDKDSRKIAEKEQKRVMRVYQQAVKDRESAIKDRKKLLEKREKKARQEREKTLKAEEKERLKVEKEDEKRKTTINPPPRRERQSSMASSSSMQDNRPKKDKKFCMLPPKHGGNIDKCWVRVYMEGVDEVGAHCGLFSPGPQYESLVGDVGARIESWVQEDARRRTTLKAHVQE